VVLRTRSRTLVASLAGLSLVTLTACGSQPSDDPGRKESDQVLQSRVAMLPRDASVDFTGTARGLLTLGHDLSTHLPASSGDGGNQVFSPASLAIAFAMLREGADAASAQEIDDVIGLPENRRAAYNALLHELSDVGPGDRLEINDAVFLDPELEVKPAYLDAIKRWYGAGLHETPFPHPALEDINAWVKTKTHDRIPRLLDDLDASAVLALVNTIYLNAKWETPFSKNATHDAAFTTTEGGTTTVKMMHLNTTLDYATGDGWQAVRLPYAGGSLSMWVLVPDGSGDPKELLAASALATAESSATPTQVRLSLPRWESETKASLVDVLKRLGMGHTFEDGAFPGISDEPRLGVSQVVQQANITVGEKGTEAAAATAIVMELTGVPVLEGVEVTADHPFAYAIVHDETGVPLFEGVVGNPSAK
jgi:serpin B